MTRSDQLVSLVRTFVPALVGLAIAALTKINADIDSAALTALVDAIVIGAYYTVVRFLEARWPKFGILLGVPKQPSYPGATDAPAGGN